MASPKRRQGSNEPNLISRSDFQLLNDFSNLVADHPSQQLKQIAWEMMRRYTSHLEASAKPEPRDYSATLGDARWGDAKRVERIFGIKRNKLINMADEGSVPSASLQSANDDGAPPASGRAKRLYCLLSLADLLERLSKQSYNHDKI